MEELKELDAADNWSGEEPSSKEGDDLDIDDIEKPTADCLQRVSKALEPVRAKFKGKKGTQPGVLPDMTQALCNAGLVGRENVQRCRHNVDTLFSRVLLQNQPDPDVALLNTQDMDNFSKAPEKFDKDVCARRGGVYNFVPKSSGSSGSQDKPGPVPEPEPEPKPKPEPAESAPPKESKQPGSKKDKDEGKDEGSTPAAGGGGGGGDSGSSAATAAIIGVLGLTAAGGLGGGLYAYSESAAGVALIGTLATALSLSETAAPAEIVQAAVSRLVSRLAEKIIEIVESVIKGAKWVIERVDKTVVRRLQTLVTDGTRSETQHLLGQELKELGKKIQ
ncbi:hypothetical protein QQS21_010850 [Conoideocrella luteorostrata]|uniref:Uncharacterized protein n=1 Tax=Conoideocrella luteorostrata TaxID=1105319 RepID=A0AAJ0CIN0_9HYPO|nr:hypothetical protein QQS21_010850 [Conoideocrella luteorostrata]